MSDARRLVAVAIDRHGKVAGHAGRAHHWQVYDIWPGEAPEQALAQQDDEMRKDVDMTTGAQAASEASVPSSAQVPAATPVKEDAAPAPAAPPARACRTSRTRRLPGPNFFGSESRLGASLGRCMKCLVTRPVPFLTAAGSMEASVIPIGQA